jgi:hypothetical protein
MLQRRSFDPDTTRAAVAAFDEMCAALAADRRDRASRRIARKVVALASAIARDCAARRSRISASIDAATNGCASA